MTIAQLFAISPLWRVLQEKVEYFLNEIFQDNI